MLESFQLFDLFADNSGEKLDASKKSLAYSLTYRDRDRTLESSEVDKAHAAMVADPVDPSGKADGVAHIFAGQLGAGHGPRPADGQRHAVELPAQALNEGHDLHPGRARERPHPLGHRYVVSRPGDPHDGYVRRPVVPAGEPLEKELDKIRYI